MKHVDSACIAIVMFTMWTLELLLRFILPKKVSKRLAAWNVVASEEMVSCLEKKYN